jgi:hypothetical protein
MNIPPTNYGDLVGVLRSVHPELIQSSLYFEHDARHTFTGSFFDNPGEVLDDAFLVWCPRGEMSVAEARKCFRHSETVYPSNTPLTEKEISIYTAYFNRLVKEYLAQTGQKEFPKALSTSSILKTPDGWLA